MTQPPRSGRAYTDLGWKPGWAVLRDATAMANALADDWGCAVGAFPGADAGVPMPCHDENQAVRW